ncbi:MAG: SUMF1/EgtB/PvdO family nonheme iron enzyme [Bacteroidetes bacterium]|nr:SUMF1/EgtB/PvdO family nonheme iron enzyme [Bacteroidota bacterium]
MKKSTLISCFTLLILVSIFSIAAIEESKQNYIGQTCPPDMEFIPGNAAIPTFFIGKSEETNLNYLIYLNWMEHVFGKENQGFITLFEPRISDKDTGLNFNDPVLRPQLRNPAFAYYPVTGLSWMQVQEYLEWKTDRLNESILIQNQIISYNPNNEYLENNFNTEAYLSGQCSYIPINRNKLTNYEKFDILCLSPNSGKSLYTDKYPYLFTQYRLPTEEEWEYAASESFQNHDLKNDKAPFGTNFFLFKYSQMSNQKDQNYWLTKYILNAQTIEPKDMNSFMGAGSYNHSTKGIYNMASGVREWLMDTFTNEVRHYTSLKEIYTKNGFVYAKQKMLKNEDNNFITKMKTGELAYKLVGIDKNGDDLWVLNQPENINYGFITKQKLRTDSLEIKAQVKRRLLKFQETRALRYFNYLRDKANYNSQYNSYNNRNNPNLSKIVDYWKQNHMDDYYHRSYGYIPQPNDTIKIPITEEMIAKYRKEWTMEYDELNFNPLQAGKHYRRVVKGGTWKNKSVTARTSVYETESYADIGFRCVLQYSGIAISKVQKVKWR